MPERLILHNVPDDTNLGAPKEAPEVLGQKKLSEFVIETRKISPTKEERFLDSVRLEAAIRNGTISEEEIVRSIQTNFGKTLTEQIAQFEELAKKNPETFQKNVETYRAMQSVHEHYIPMHGNCTLDLSGLNEKQNTVRDIVDWCKDNPSEIRFEGRVISPDQLARTLSEKTTDWASRRAHVEMSLDYPSLSHGLAITVVGREASRRAELTFYGNSQDALEGKIHSTVDMVSALGVLNHFKQKGYEPELEMRQNPTKEGDLEVNYIAK